MNSLFGDNVKKVIDFYHEFKTENWMETEYDDRVQDYHKF